MIEVGTLVVAIVPIGSADVAERVPAPANHVVAAFRALDEDVALGAALQVLEVFFEVSLASPLVLRELTLLAEAHSALETLQSPPAGVNDSLAVGGGAQPEVGVADGLLPEGVPPESVLRLLGQPIVDAALWIQHCRAALLGACDFAHDVDFVDAVGVEALDAEAMFAVSDAVHVAVGVRFFAELAFASHHGTVLDEIWQN
jgi:hypothetical protein